MITFDHNLFSLATAHSGYYFRVMPSGHLEHLHYGRPITLAGDSAPLCEKREFNGSCLVSYAKAYTPLGLEDLCLEMSSYGKGDLRQPFIELRFADGSWTVDLLFESARIYRGKAGPAAMPASYGSDEEAMTLEVTLYDRQYDIELLLTYCVFEKADVITRFARVINRSDQPVYLERLMSNQVDFDTNDYRFTTFKGAWIREMTRYDTPCEQGVIVHESLTGASSNRANPFVMLAKNATGEDAGDCYGFHLVYSGNHLEAVETNCYGKVRFVQGIQPTGFSFLLEPGQSFDVPEAIMAYSPDGYTGLSHILHAFIRRHIVRGEWRDRVRPVLVNSWEACYFDFNEEKLLALARAASAVGVELFVLDDGWFGRRDDDISSLGDWYVDKRKLPHGIQGLSDQIAALGMKFGIWVEPEMVNEDSDLYRAHPDWAVQNPRRDISHGRNQMILDFTRQEVRDYILERLRDIFSQGVSYVKWDFNRIFSDYYSQALPANRQQEFSHRYVLGLYEVLDTLTKEFPHILFENCASGGNRFDLGMTCYMPQTWASDNTDAMSRVEIQNGYSYGYPTSLLAAHFSSCPNHQTLRVTPSDTRFHVAAFGLLGYECNLAQMSEEALAMVKEQIAFYKRYRALFQFGTYYRIKNGGKDGIYEWMAVSPDQRQAIAVYLRKNVVANTFYAKLEPKGLKDDALYAFSNREVVFGPEEFAGFIQQMAPQNRDASGKLLPLAGEREYAKVYGDVLNHAGIKLKPAFNGSGYNENVRLFPDFASRMYLFEQID